ncbi:MAG: hypothetical protein J0M07_20880 [Anaerolineae bacterium]|nr:hypothetical protein [Anaerolineae bacterium]
MKRLFRFALALTLVLVVSSAARSALKAQDGVSEQDAIDLALTNPILASGLGQIDGWTAAAYDTQNAYHIWRVQFWDADGEDLGWADVDPALGKIYSFEAHFSASEAQRDAAYPLLREFIDNAPDVLALVENPSAYNIWVDWDGWNRWWGVYVDIGEDSLALAIRFDNGLTPDDLTNPQLVSVYFPNVVSYEEWQSMAQSAAVAVAFRTPAIADAVAGRTWTTQVERADDGLWRVIFLEGETPLAEVLLDNAMQTVVDYSVGE